MVISSKRGLGVLTSLLRAPGPSWLWSGLDQGLLRQLSGSTFPWALT